MPLCLAHFYIPTIVLLFTALVGYCIAETLRYRGVTVPLISAITAAAARKRDENTFVRGPVTLAVGIIITALFFEPEPARIGILGFALGDGLASLMGKCYGKTPIPFVRGKTCVGSLTCFAAVFVSTFAVTNNAGISLINAFTGMALEILPLKDYDNLLLPVALAALNQYVFPLIAG